MPTKVILNCLLPQVWVEWKLVTSCWLHVTCHPEKQWYIHSSNILEQTFLQGTYLVKSLFIRASPSLTVTAMLYVRISGLKLIPFSLLNYWTFDLSNNWTFAVLISIVPLVARFTYTVNLDFWICREPGESFLSTRKRSLKKRGYLSHTLVTVLKVMFDLLYYSSIETWSFLNMALLNRMNYNWFPVQPECIY